MEKIMNNKMVQIIVSCQDYIKDYDCVKRMGNIKYRLPMIDSYVVEVNEEQLEEMIENKVVTGYELDAHITAQIRRASDEIEVEWAHKRNIYGEGIGVAIVDTGICKHEDFMSDKSRVVAFYDVVNKRK